jgi:hypothetical protein
MHQSLSTNGESHLTEWVSSIGSQSVQRDDGMRQLAAYRVPVCRYELCADNRRLRKVYFGTVCEAPGPM